MCSTLQPSIMDIDIYDFKDTWNIYKNQSCTGLQGRLKIQHRRIGPLESPIGPLGEPSTARRPNSANRLFLPIKHYWNTAIPIYLHIVCGCFHATMGELVAATEIILNTKLKIFSPDQCSSLVGHHPTK